MINLPQASTFAANVDFIYNVIYWFSWISFIIVIGLMLYYVVKYPRSKVDPNTTPFIDGHHPTEIGISIFLFVVVMYFFVIGWNEYDRMLKAPKNSLEINVVGKQWLWEFEYTNGRKMLNEIVVPKGRPVKLLMTSNDVLHSFYVPNFRIKQDVVPNTYTTVWFEATMAGDHIVFCTEYCGTAHAKMLANIKVVEPAEFDKWQSLWEVEQRLGLEPTQMFAKKVDESEKVLTPAEKGQKLFAEKGCIACHSPASAQLVGPAINGIFGHEVELADGSKVMIDENYIRQSITEPQSQIVKGFAPVMPTYKGTLTDEEIGNIISYIKSLK